MILRRKRSYNLKFLPDDCLEIIFLFLKPNDLFENVALVNNDFNRIINNDFFILQLIRKYKIMDSIKTELVSRTTSINLDECNFGKKMKTQIEKYKKKRFTSVLSTIIDKYIDPKLKIGIVKGEFELIEEIKKMVVDYTLNEFFIFCSKEHNIKINLVGRFCSWYINND